jgi:predicted 3-demethylubiquinone-9 3-methyltransferase (glyoxalase superfamily)
MHKITPFLWFDGTAEEAMLQDKSAEKATGVMKAMLQMDKLDITRLQQAYDRG